MKIIVKSKSVTFRRKVYAPGDEIDLPDKIAKNLIDAGVCETPNSKKEVKNVSKKMSNSR